MRKQIPAGSIGTKEAAAALGISKGHLVRLARELGINTSYNPPNDNSRIVAEEERKRERRHWRILWTGEDLDRIRNHRHLSKQEVLRLAKEGLSAETIAEATRYNPKTVVFFIREDYKERHGHRRPQTSLDYDKVWELHKGGCSGGEIARRLKCSVSGVSRILRGQRGKTQPPAAAALTAATVGTEIGNG